MGALTWSLCSSAGHCFSGWGKSSALTAPAWVKHNFNLSELALGLPKAAWALRPLSAHVLLGCSWPAGPQAASGENMDWQTQREFVRLGWGVGLFLGNQAGNSTHSSKTRKIMPVLGCANREINSQAKTTSLFIACLLSYSSKCSLSSMPKCTPTPQILE